MLSFCCPTAKSFQKKRKKKSRKSGSVVPPLSPDSSHLMFTHHRAMLGALCLTPALLHSRSQDGGGGRGVRGRGQDGGGGGGVRGRVLVIGLGGGALPTFIQRYLPQVRQSLQRDMHITLVTFWGLNHLRSWLREWNVCYFPVGMCGLVGNELISGGSPCCWDFGSHSSLCGRWQVVYLC